ncbi:hypothetical protein HMI54_014138 [Coelomomyces lativittatus]|nr:hypothetical protein HMI54_014138 [Coelomomyces lativittatus]
MDRAMEQMDLLVDLHTCLTHLQTSIDKQDWETATKELARHFHPPASSHFQEQHDLEGKEKLILPSSSSSSSPTSMTRLSMLYPYVSTMHEDVVKARNALTQAHQDVVRGVQATFQKALSGSLSMDTSMIEQCFQWCASLQAYALGRQGYTQYLCTLLKKQCELAMTPMHLDTSSSNVLDAKKQPTVYVSLITKLYENLAQVIDQTFQKMSHARYPPDVTWVSLLLEVAEPFLLSWLTAWGEARELNQLKVNLSLSSTSTTLFHTIEVVMQEWGILLQRSAYYHRFLKARGLQSLGSLDRPWFNLVTTWQRMYMEMEWTCFQYNGSQAMQLDQRVPFSWQSTCVDDVFYVLKKSVMRAISTCAWETLPLFLQPCYQLIEKQVVKVLQRKAMTYLAMCKDDGGVMESRQSFNIQLNNLHQLMVFLPKFIDEVATHLQVFLTPTDPRRSPIDAWMILFNQLSHAQVSFLTTQFHGYFQACVQPSLLMHVIPLIQTLLYCQWNEEQYAEAVSRNQWIGNQSKCLVAFQTILSPLKEELIPENFNTFLLLIMEYVLKEWEKLIFTRKFTQYGALYLERDFRSLVQFFQSQGHHTLEPNIDDPVTKEKKEKKEEKEEETSTSSHVSSATITSTSLSLSPSPKLTESSFHRFPSSSTSPPPLPSIVYAWSHCVRDTSLRLQQLVMVLNLTHVTEIYDYYGPHAVVTIPWKWKGMELKRILNLRMDFSYDVIQSLTFSIHG